MLCPVFRQVAVGIAPVHGLGFKEAVESHLDQFGTVVGIVVGEESVVVGFPDKAFGTGNDRIRVEGYGEAVDVESFYSEFSFVVVERSARHPVLRGGLY